MTSLVQNTQPTLTFTNIKGGIDISTNKKKGGEDHEMHHPKLNACSCGRKAKNS